jgi:hypothetical protein
MDTQVIQCATEWAVDRLARECAAQGYPVTVTREGEYWYVAATPRR